MKRFAMAVALACILSSTTLAGIIPSTDVKAPEPETPGNVPTSDVAEPPVIAEALTTLLRIFGAVV